MPKAKGDPYFISCKLGADEAAKALNVDLIWDGPTGLDAAKQNELVQGWITRHVDAISVSVENAPGISTPLIDRLVSATRRAGATGAKACGAGGGGCVIFLVEAGGVMADPSGLKYIRRGPSELKFSTRWVELNGLGYGPVGLRES